MEISDNFELVIWTFKQFMNLSRILVGPFFIMLNRHPVSPVKRERRRDGREAGALLPLQRRHEPLVEPLKVRDFLGREEVRLGPNSIEIFLA